MELNDGPGLVLEIVDPGVRVEERPGALIIVSGAPAPLPAGFAAPGDATGRDEADLARRLGDATVIRIETEAGEARRIRIWKGLTAGHEVFAGRTADGGVIVSDHFRNAVAALPPSARAPEPAAVLDHFLVRHVPGRLTYARGLMRPAHGECLSLDLPAGAVQRTVFDRMEAAGPERPAADWEAQIGGALSGVLQPVARVPGIVNMLSGGIDSSLIQTYLGRDVPAVTVAPDSAAFNLGGTRAQMVAQALGVPLRRVTVSGAEFLDQLEAAIDARGLPPQYPQWVTLARVFDGPDAAYVVGERADSLFSREGGRVPMVARHLANPLGALAMPLLEMGARMLHKRGFQLLPDQVRSMRHDPLSPEGWASRLTLNTDLALMSDVFGADAVQERLAARLAYVGERARLLPATADRYARNLEAAQWLVFYDEHILLFRHLAFAYGKQVFAPFSTRALLTTALAIPPSHRYSRMGEAKYLLNDLLRARLPSYDTRARKDHIEMPMADYYASGPLAGIWERYPVPDMFEGTARDRLTGTMTEATWNAITYAVWRARIVDNPGLQPHPARFQRCLGIARASA